MNYNHATRQCELGLSKCDSLAPVVGGVGNVCGPPRDTCVHWGSNQEPPGRVPVEIPGRLRMACTRTGDTLLVGKFNINSHNFWANSQGVQVGPILETDQLIGFLTMDIACMLVWMSHKADGSIPAGVISGGHLSDRSTTYVVHVMQYGQETLGYYSTAAGLVGNQLGGSGFIYVYIYSLLRQWIRIWLT